MKKIMFFLLLIITLIGITGCDISDELQDEINFEDEPIEDRTYDGVVYDKAYFSIAEDRTSKTESWYAFNETEKKVIIERQGGIKRSKSSKLCHVLEGTYEGELGDKITITITKQDNKIVEDVYQKTLYFSDENNDKHRYESPSTTISRVKICYAEIQNR